MLSPTNWQQTPYGNPDAWHTFLGENARSHTLIRYQVVAQGFRQYNTVPLGDGGGAIWLAAHFNEHRDINHVLGLTPPPDLASYDLEDKEQFEDWMESHADEHRRINATLSIV